MTKKAKTKTQQIRELNDLLRTTFLSGKVLFTEGIVGLEDHQREQIITKVREFKDFNKGDDPYGEHDFGKVVLPGGLEAYWKIDYYDSNMEYGSEDPSNPLITTRVLTIMLTCEY